MSEKRLITAAEVIRTAFGVNDQITVDAIPEAKIEEAELKFIKPVFGGLYKAMIAGQYTAFADDFVKAPLAYFVKYLIVPEICVKIGDIGVVRNKNVYSDVATTKDMYVMRREVRETAYALLKKAVEHVEQNPGDFPEYCPEDNVYKRLTISGGIIL